MAVDLGGSLANAGVKLPNLSGASNWVVVFLMGILGAIIIGGLVWWILDVRRYNKRVIVFRKVSGKVVPILQTKGMFERVGIAGDYWLRCKGGKIVNRPTIETGANSFWFYQREDGEWINFGLQNLDELMKNSGVFYIDEDMRMMRLGIERNLQMRYDKQGFWDKYGQAIMLVVVTLVLAICIILVFNKMKELIGELKGVSGAVLEMARSVDYMSGRVGVTSAEVNATWGGLS